MKASKRAFTLVELLVAIAVMGLLSVGLLGFLGNFLDLKIRAEAKLRLREEGNYALDRIEYLIRNSITLPDICMYDVSTNTTLEDRCKATNCTNGVTGALHDKSHDGNTVAIKFNLRGENRTMDYIHRMRVFYTYTPATGANPEYGDIVEVSTYPSGKTHSDTLAKTDGYSLTRAGSGSISAASNSFKVTDFAAQCFYDKAFVNGYIVRIKFKIRYDRDTLGSRDDNLTKVEEEFARDVAVRNTGNFQN